MRASAYVGEQGEDAELVEAVLQVVQGEQHGEKEDRGKPDENLTKRFSKKKLEKVRIMF
jgi:hypothetical protein